MGSCAVVVFTWVRPGGRWIHQGSLGSLGFAFGVVVLIRGCWIHSSSRWGSLGSSGFVGFTRVRAGVVGFNPVRAGSRWVHPGSLSSLLGVVGCALWVVGFMRGRWDHSDLPWGSLGSSEVVGFTLVGRWVHPPSLGSLSLALGVVGFIRCR